MDEIEDDRSLVRRRGCGEAVRAERGDDGLGETAGLRTRPPASGEAPNKAKVRVAFEAETAMSSS
jgi:hypothetical protein